MQNSGSEVQHIPRLPHGSITKFIYFYHRFFFGLMIDSAEKEVLLLVYHSDNNVDNAIIPTKQTTCPQCKSHCEDQSLCHIQNFRNIYKWNRNSELLIHIWSVEDHSNLKSVYKGIHFFRGSNLIFDKWLIVDAHRVFQYSASRIFVRIEGKFYSCHLTT